LNDDGTAEIGTIVEAIEQVISLQQNTDIPAVINLSLGADIGTTAYTALDQAVDAASAAGIVVVAAAGNQGIDASTVTPAHAESAITVGAYDQLGIFASFSNYGETLDILAPGVDVFTLGISAGGNVVGTLMSGTSLAAPHVAGAAALYLSYYPEASPVEVRNALIDASRAQSLAVPAHTTSRTLWVGENFPLSSGSLLSRLFGR
jgi:subtilisin family serine protease